MTFDAAADCLDAAAILQHMDSREIEPRALAQGGHNGHGFQKKTLYMYTCLSGVFFIDGLK